MITHFGFSGGLLPGQLVIEAATFDPSAHCFVRISGGTIIDSTYTHGGVKERDFTDLNYDWIKLIPADRLLTVSQNYRLEVWLRDRIGRPYDKGFIIGYPWTRRWQDDDSYVCSELLAAGLVAVGALVIPHMHRVTPRNLRRRIDEKVK